MHDLPHFARNNRHRLRHHAVRDRSAANAPLSSILETTPEFLLSIHSKQGSNYTIAMASFLLNHTQHTMLPSKAGLSLGAKFSSMEVPPEHGSFSCFTCNSHERPQHSWSAASNNHTFDKILTLQHTRLFFFVHEKAVTKNYQM